MFPTARNDYFYIAPVLDRETTQTVLVETEATNAKDVSFDLQSEFISYEAKRSRSSVGVNPIRRLVAHPTR